MRSTWCGKTVYYKMSKLWISSSISFPTKFWQNKFLVVLIQRNGYEECALNSNTACRIHVLTDPEDYSASFTSSTRPKKPLPHPKVALV
ncbi:hypothetical protein DPMN_009305 [Dreissena polymorpha]|uniref:Uncharacterized protein n=1 Tax=Dreissena polymorpha TaxID=45954 RepID=A0A9D4N093_DREPO|nr:hypothetical protein DPMN_009305 [Dreissena polymorpha]